MFFEQTPEIVGFFANLKKNFRQTGIGPFQCIRSTDNFKVKSAMKNVLNLFKAFGQQQ